MRFLKEFSIVEQIALEIMVDIISENSNLNRKYRTIVENSIRKRFYSQGRVPRELFDTSKVSYTISDVGNIVKGQDIFGNIFDDLNYGDYTMVFDNPFHQEEEIQWKRVFFFEMDKDLKDTKGTNMTSSLISENYIKAEKLAILNIIIMFKGYEQHYTKKSFEKMQNQFDNRGGALKKESLMGKGLGMMNKGFKNFNKGIKSINELVDQGENIHKLQPIRASNLNENEVMEGLRLFFKRYFNELRADRVEGRLSSYNPRNSRWMTENHLRTADTPAPNFSQQQSSQPWCKEDKIHKRLLVHFDEIDIEEVKYFSMPQNMYSLMQRKMITKKMNTAKIYTREFISDKEKDIFVLIKPMIVVIAEQATKMRIQKEVELGAVDAFSMVPVEDNLRPLIYKPFYFKEMMNKEMEIEDDDPVLINEEVISSKGIAKAFIRVRSLGTRQFRDQYKKRLELHIKILRDLFNYVGEGNKMSCPYKLLDNNLLTRNELELNYIFTMVFQFWGKKLSKIRKMSGLEYPFLLRLCLMKSIYLTNQGTKSATNILDRGFAILMRMKTSIVTIWDQLRIKPTLPYSQFSSKPRYLKLYKTYEINETGNRSIFTPQERIKLTLGIIESLFNLAELKSAKVMKDVYPLHDCYLLEGVKKKPMFKAVFKDTELVDSYESEDGNIGTHGQQNTDPLELFKDTMISSALDSDFIGDHLSKGCQFGWNTIVWMPIEELRNYFGEKIALYFYYVLFQARMNLVMSIVVIFYYMITWYLESQYPKFLIFMYSLCITIWSSIYIQRWRNRESLFALSYGQVNSSDDRTFARPQYQGKLVKSISSNNFNVYQENPVPRMAKMFGSLMISLIIIALAIIVVFFLLWFKIKLKELGAGFYIYTLVPPILNTIQIIIFNMIYTSIAYKTCHLENHRIRETFENSMIIKLFCFSFANTFNSFFIIAFVKENSFFAPLHFLIGNCIGVGETTADRCFSELNTQMFTIFIVTFFTNFLEILIPMVKLFLAQKKERLELRDYDWGQVDRRILEESRKDTYEQSLDIDGTLGDYMSLLIEFSFLSLFGLSFPMAFPIAFMSDVAQCHIDKVKFFYLTRRPIPKNAKSIGFWNKIMETVALGSIVVNSALVVYTINVTENFQPPLDTGESYKSVNQQVGRMADFVALCFLMLFIHKMIGLYYSGHSKTHDLISRRQKRVMEENIPSGMSSKSVFTFCRGGLTETLDSLDRMKMFMTQQEEDALNGAKIIKRSVDKQKLNSLFDSSKARKLIENSMGAQKSKIKLKAERAGLEGVVEQDEEHLDTEGEQRMERGYSEAYSDSQSMEEIMAGNGGLQGEEFAPVKASMSFKTNPISKEVSLATNSHMPGSQYSNPITRESNTLRKRKPDLDESDQSHQFW